MPIVEHQGPAPPAAHAFGSIKPCCLQIRCNFVFLYFFSVLISLIYLGKVVVHRY
jgi:hypothetical protein